LMPPAPARDNDKQETARAVINMALPTEKKPAKKEVQEKDPSEGLLPEPELDFSNAPHVEVTDSDVTKIRMPLLGSKGRVRGLSALLAVVAVGAIWYLKLWTYLPLPPLGKKAAVTTTTSPTRPDAPRTVPAAITNPKVADKAKANTASPPETNSSQASPKDEQNNDTARLPEPEAQQTEEDSTKKSERRAEKPKKEDSADADAAPTATQNIASDSPLQPAKLLKSANPVYPPDAMTNYITGDVKAEVDVDASGHVGEVKVISGPAALRDAAVAALKQYQYSPATQGGKAVSSKAIEIVKFWFNP
jgi:TonB family protein